MIMISDQEVCYFVPSHCCVSSARLFTDRIKTIITNLKNTGEERERETTQGAGRHGTGLQSARVELNISQWNTPCRLKHPARYNTVTD